MRSAVPMKRRRGDEPGSDELAELAALADGSLAPKQRAALEARVAADPELADRLAEQRRAVALHPKRRVRGRGPVRPARAHRDAAPRAPRADAPRPDPRLRRRARCGGTRHRAPGDRFRHLRRELQGSSRTHRRRARREWGRDVHQDGLGLADRARCHGPATPPGRALLPGLAASAAGGLVPIGTFNEGRKVTLWAGVSPKDYPTLTVTLERADGNQASSARRCSPEPRARPADPRPDRSCPCQASTRRTTSWRAR